MRVNRQKVKFLIRQSLQGWRRSFLISVCLALVILVGIFFLGRASYEDVEVGECPTDDLAYTLNLISPAQLGVAQWQIGEYAVYRYRRKLGTPALVLERYFSPDATKARLASRDVRFDIIGELSKSGRKRYWMRVTGLVFFRAIPADIYRLVFTDNLRITSETPRYDFARGYVPLRFSLCHQTSTPLATLVKLDEVSLETPAGSFDCIRYRAEFGSVAPPIEIWANPYILPLGIVRASTPYEVLELAAYGRDMDFNIPELIHPVIEGISTLEQGCTSCHGYDNCHKLISPPR